MTRSVVIYRAEMLLAAPMWGIVQDHVAAAVTIDDPRTLSILEAASEDEWYFNSEWVRRSESTGASEVVLRVDLGREDGAGLDLALPPEPQDVESLAAYELLEVWIESKAGDTHLELRSRPRKREILESALAEQMGAGH